MNSLESSAAAAALLAFAPYRQELAEHEAAIMGGQPPQLLEGYLTKGVHSLIFAMQDGAIAKLPLVEFLELGVLEEPDVVVAESVASLLLGQKGMGLEQIVAFSLHKPSAWVCQRAPGQTLKNTEPTDTIPMSHLRRLLATFRFMQHNDLVIDPAPDNFLYDPNEGFTIIDYSHAAYEGAQGFAYKVSTFGTDLLPYVSCDARVLRRYGAQAANLIGPTASRQLFDTWRIQGYDV